jgi:hypothetical protein
MEKYEELEMEVIAFEEEDVITTSGINRNSGNIDLDLLDILK